MQFSDIRTYCAMRFRDTGNVVVTDANWKLYANTIYGEILTQFPFAPWREAVETVAQPANNRIIDLPAGAWQVVSVFDGTNQYPLVPLEGRDQAYQLYPDQAAVGAAQHYRVFTNSVWLYPVPQDATSYVIEYLVGNDQMVADSDTPMFPDPYHDLIVSGAVMLAYKDDGNLQMAAAYAKEYEDGLKILKQEAGQPRTSRFYQIVDYEV